MKSYATRSDFGPPEPHDEQPHPSLCRVTFLCWKKPNARITPLQAVLRYRDLIQVEDLFRRVKAILRTRPIYHSSDAAIRGHVFCSFLALVLQKELADRCRAAGFAVEWGKLLRDLDRLQEATIDKDGKRIPTRTAVTGEVGDMFCSRPPASRLRPHLREHRRLT